MNAWIPANDPPPPDDFHTWAQPASEPCPDCPCCSARLCARAIEKNSACHHEAGTGDYDVSKCPCWLRGSTARARLARAT